MSLLSTLILPRGKKAAKPAYRRALSRRVPGVESLEARTLFSLLGVQPGLPITTQVNVSAGAVSYSAANETFDVVSTPSVFLADASSIPVTVTGPSDFEIHIKVDNSGNLLGSGSAANDLLITGSIDTNNDGTPDYSGTLLTGTVTGFGWDPGSGGTSAYDFTFTTTGGALAPLFVNSNIGATISSESSTFTGSFTSDFSGFSKGSVGPIPQPVGKTPPISISGKKVLDLTGNGESADDTGLGGVTINLYADTNSNGTYNAGTDQLVASTVTASDGTYSFNNLTAGTYFVSEVVPTGYLETGPTTGNLYTVNATTAGANYGGNDFANYFLDCDLADFTNIHFLITGSNGVTTTVTNLRGNTHQGDQVTAVFTVPAAEAGHTLTLVSYTAPDSYFNANDASQQKEFDIDSEVVHAGVNTLTVQNPNCDYQVDFVCGAAIDKLGPAGSNIFYSAQMRLFSADNEGTCACTNATGQLSGYVWDDSANDNGVKDAGEAGIGNVEVKLTGGGLTLYRITAADGSYSFKGLKAGTYSIAEVGSVPGYLDGNDQLGSLGGIKSNDLFSSIVLTTGASGVNYNFGEIKSTSVCGNICCTYGKNSFCDGGDKITLTGCDDHGNKVTCTTTTDSHGNYSFSGLRQGSYTVCDADFKGKSSSWYAGSGTSTWNCVYVCSSSSIYQSDLKYFG